MSRNAIFYKNIDYSRGGSGGGGASEIKMIYDSESNTAPAPFNTSITYADNINISDYDLIIATFSADRGSVSYPQTSYAISLVDDVLNDQTNEWVITGYENRWVRLRIDENAFTVREGRLYGVYKLFAIKLGSGGGGGGGSTTLYGETPPTSNQGNNGDLYFYYSKGVFKYIKMNITKDRSNDGNCQLADIRFANSNSEFFSFVGNNATAESNRNYATSGETAASVIDNNVGTKVLMTNNAPSVNNPDTLIITIPDGINLTEYDTYSWYTANDATSRDPMSWTLSASNDKENWVELDSQENYNTTESRQVVAYSKQLENVSGAIGIIKKYVKIEDTWVAF